VAARAWLDRAPEMRDRPRLLIIMPTLWVGSPPSWRRVKGCNVLCVCAESLLRKALHVLM
jgi:hypothetical protein